VFEQSRKSTVGRLGALMDRFELIISEAAKWQEKSDLAVRRGVNLGGTDPLVFEIQIKANEQLALCGESITLLLRDRALPWLFKRGVSKAERFADQCEAALSQFAEAEELGKAAFHERMGKGQ